MLKLAFPLLALCALSSCLAADRTAHLSAKELFLAVEARYVNAPNVSWSSDLDPESDLDQKSNTVRSFRTEFSFEGNDKFRIAIKEKRGKLASAVLQSDGVHAFMIAGDPGERTDIPVRGDIGRIARKVVVRAGFFILTQTDKFSFSDLTQPEDVARILPIDGLRYGLDTLVQGRETRMIEYTLNTQPVGPSLKMSLWIDRRTMAILRRESTVDDSVSVFERILDTVFD